MPGLTLMLAVVSPVLHVFAWAALEESFTLSPWQMVVLPVAEMVGVAGVGFTVTVATARPEVHPLGFFTITEYVCVPVGVTVMLALVSVVLQTLYFAALDFKVMELPKQIVVEPVKVLIVGVAGIGFTITVVPNEVAEQLPTLPLTTT